MFITHSVHTVCPRSLDQLYVVTYYIKWVNTSWTNSNTYMSLLIQRIVGELDLVEDDIWVHPEATQSRSLRVQVIPKSVMVKNARIQIKLLGKPGCGSERPEKNRSRSESDPSITTQILIRLNFSLIKFPLNFYLSIYKSI